MTRDTSKWDGGRLRQLRESAGLTQTQLAEQVGVQRDAVARWEAGNREPGWSNVLALADALGVSCEAFKQPPSAEQGKPGRGRPKKVEQADQVEPTPPAAKPDKKKRKG